MEVREWESKISILDCLKEETRTTEMEVIIKGHTHKKR